MLNINVDKIKKELINEFSSVIIKIEHIYINEFRVIFIDESFLDVWFSLKIENRYSYHWERKIIDNTIYRHDNTPHIKWKNVKTFPKHFHNKSEMNVEASYISDNPEVAVVEMLNFIKEIITIN